MSGGVIPDRDTSGNIVNYYSPFSSKAVKEGKIFRRLHGVVSALLASGDSTVELVIPYDKAKITGVELLWFPEGVTTDMEVFDTPTGAIQLAAGVPPESVVPNKKLNQFGFTAGIGKDFHKDVSEYDADLIKDMKIKLTFHNSSTTAKNVCTNFLLHEVR